MVWDFPPSVSSSALRRISTARRRISIAARRVKVSSMMRAGSTPLSTRCATRCASVLVLPVPAPAIISSGPERSGASGTRLAEARSLALRVVQGFKMHAGTGHKL